MQNLPFKCNLHCYIKGAGMCTMLAQRGECTHPEKADAMRRECKNSCCRVAAIIRFKQKQAQAAANQARHAREAAEAAEAAARNGTITADDATRESLVHI